MLSYHHALTIVVVCSSTSPIRIFANFNASKTHLSALFLSLSLSKKKKIIHPYVPARTLRTLRSSSSSLLQMPSARTITYGERAFSIRVSRLWNSLPLNIKQAGSVDHFKGTLNTISVQTGIRLVTHSFIVFCSSLIIFVFFNAFAL